MRWTTARLLSVGALAGLWAASCDSATGSKEPKIALSLASSSATIGQGSSATVVLTITRSNYTSGVNLTVDGLPAGVTASFDPASVPSTSSTSTLQISASGAATPGSSTLTVHATGDGVTEQTVTVALTVTVTGTFSLAPLTPSVSVAQGGGGTATILVVRAGGNGGNVSLSVSGAPAGVTATISPTSTTEKGVSLRLAAAGSATPGTYLLTITGSSPGLTPDQTTTLSVVVGPPPNTVQLTIPSCSISSPIWFAYQNEGYDWQRITPTGTSFSFAATQKVAIAYVWQPSPSSFETEIYYSTRAELSGFTDTDCRGPNTVTGTVGAVSSTQTARISLGSADTTVRGPATDYTLKAVQDRALDLMATRGIVSQGFLTPDKIIIRRSLTLANASTIPVLDFSAEGFVPDALNLTIGGVQAGEELYFQNLLLTRTATSGLIHNASPATGSVQFYSTPASQLVPGDLHELYVEASQSTNTAAAGRTYFTYFVSTGNRSDALGPVLNSPAVSFVCSVPYVRMRQQLASQSEYGTSVRFAYDQGRLRTIFLGVSAAYLGATPASWDAVMPDLSAASGFDTNWMLGAGFVATVYQAEAFSGRTDLLFGAPPAEGDLVRTSYRAALTSTAFRAGPAAVRLRAPHQYFRR